MPKQMRMKEVLVETQKTNVQLKEGLVEMRKSRYNSQFSFSRDLRVSEYTRPNICI